MCKHIHTKDPIYQDLGAAIGNRPRIAVVVDCFMQCCVAKVILGIDCLGWHPLCVAVCCSMLQCVAVCSNVLQCVAVCCSVLQCVAVCRSVLQ